MNTNEELRRLAQNWQSNARAFRRVALLCAFPDEHPLTHHAAIFTVCADQLLEVVDAAEAERVAAEQDEEYLRIMKNVEALLSKPEREA